MTIENDDVIYNPEHEDDASDMWNNGEPPMNPNPEPDDQELFACNAEPEDLMDIIDSQTNQPDRY